MRAKNLGDLYDLPLIAWADVEARLNAGLTEQPEPSRPSTAWLATINPDGTPHVTGVGALWADGAFWFKSGNSARKARNVARDARCTLSLSTTEFDVVVEGKARKITEPAIVAARVKEWNAGGWPVTSDETGALTAPFSAPSAGPPPWFVYRVTPKSATVVGGTDPGGATRFTF